MEPTFEASTFLELFFKNIKTIRDEFKNIFDDGLNEYLYSQTEKFYFTNTFLHRSEKVIFREIYYPINATYKLFTTNFYNLKEVFDNYKNLTIIGSAGSGKTTLIRHIFLHCIQDTFKIPILLELRNLNLYQGSFQELLEEKILSQNIKPNGEILQRALKKGVFLFLLDGYDEVFSERKNELNRQIESFIDSYSKNNYIITTRPGSGVESFPRFYDFRVNDLDDNDVKAFLEKIVKSEERKNRIIEIIEDPKQNAYLHYLRNPLLLSMFILAFESHPEIPSRKSSFYRNVFDTLYSKHDGLTKNSFPREKLTKFEREDFEKILKIFSYHTFINGVYTYTNEYLTDTLDKVIKSLGLECKIESLIYDLRTSISILVLDGFEYHFPHRSMQEYFTAQFISTLPSEKKAKAYSILCQTYKKGEDLSLYTWRLCEELDKRDFTVYLLIEALQDYAEKLKGTSDKEILDNYCKIISPAIYSPKRNKFNIYRLHNFYSELNEYTNSYDYLIFSKFIENPDIKEKLKQYCFSNGIELIDGVDIEIDDNMKDFLLKNGIVEIVKGFRVSLLNKIKTLKREISNKDSDIEKLLGF